MPLSTNAPFNEFGQSMILRDIEQLYLSLNGAGSGSAGEAQTQDQTVGLSQETGDSGGLPDLSGLATIDYVDQVAEEILASVPTVSYPISIANGGTGASSAVDAIQALGWVGSRTSSYTSGTGSFSIPSNVSRVLIIAVGGGGGADTTTVSLYGASSSGGATTVNMSRIGGGGGGGGGAMILIDTSGLSSLSYTIGAGGTSGAAPTGGSPTTVSATGVSISIGGGLAGSGPSSGLGGGYTTGATAGTSSWTGVNVLWGASFPGHSGYIGFFGGSMNNGFGSPAGIMANGSGAGASYGRGGDSITNGQDGFVMFIY